MNLLRNIMPLNNCEDIIIVLCQSLKISVTDDTLKRLILQHSEYPSLYAIGDVLNSLGVDNVSLKTKEITSLFNLNSTFLCQVKASREDRSLFAVVYNISYEKVEWYDPEKRKNTKISFSEFERRFLGFLQIYKKTDRAGEDNYQEKKRNKIIVNGFVGGLILLIVSCFLFTVTSDLGIIGSDGISTILYTTIALLGVITTFCLLIFEIDQFNPSFQSICQLNSKTSCSAVMSSSGAKIFNVSWSIIGFSYFSGILLFILSSGSTPVPYLSTAAVINILAVPYVLFSIIYQGFIVKKWCPMCLLVQFEILLLFFISLIHSSLFFSNFAIRLIPSFLIFFLIVFINLFVFFPFIKRDKSYNMIHRRFKNIKHNQLVFNAILHSGDKIDLPNADLGILRTQPCAKKRIIKVCSPYCNPCSSVHPLIDELLENNPQVELQTIFYVTENESDYRNKAVRTFLAIKEKFSNEEATKALDLWYKQEKKDYQYFKTVYPFDDSTLKSQDIRIKEMREWCKRVNVIGTPSFFIDGYPLPDEYSADDLKYIINS